MVIPVRVSARAAVVCLAAALSACGSSNGMQNGTQPSGTLVGIAITGATTLVGTGQTSQLTATAAYSSGDSQTVSDQATWQSSNTAVATVSSTGLVTEVSFGQTTISAVYQGVPMTALVLVVPNFAGTWSASSTTSKGTTVLTLVLSQTGATVSGTLSSVRNGGAAPFSYVGTFGGPISVATLSWTFTLSDPNCSGSGSGVGTVASPSLTLNPAGATFSGSANGCTDNSSVPPPGLAIVFAKQ